MYNRKRNKNQHSYLSSSRTRSRSTLLERLLFGLRESSRRRGETERESLSLILLTGGDLDLERERRELLRGERESDRRVPRRGDRERDRERRRRSRSQSMSLSYIKNKISINL